MATCECGNFFEVGDVCLECARERAKEGLIEFALIGRGMDPSSPRRGADYHSQPGAEAPASIPANHRWLGNDYYIRMNGVPVLVDIDFDSEAVGDPLRPHGEVRLDGVHAACPTCFNQHESEDCCDWSHSHVFFGSVLTCECSGEQFELHFGVPAEFKEIK